MSAKTDLQAWCLAARDEVAGYQAIMSVRGSEDKPQLHINFRAASERMNMRKRGDLLARLVDEGDVVFCSRPQSPIYTHFTGPVAVRHKP